MKDGRQNWSREYWTDEQASRFMIILFRKPCLPIYGAARPPRIRWPNGPRHKQRVLAPCSTLDSSGRHLLTVQGFETARQVP